MRVVADRRSFQLCAAALATLRQAAQDQSPFWKTQQDDLTAMVGRVIASRAGGSWPPLSPNTEKLGGQFGATTKKAKLKLRARKNGVSFAVTEKTMLWFNSGAKRGGWAGSGGGRKMSWHWYQSATYRQPPRPFMLVGQPDIERIARQMLGFVLRQYAAGLR